MSDDSFDAIIVGGGVAGLTTSWMLANEGLDVVLIDRGNFCGSKNMTGGRLYSHSLEKIMPGFADEAPVERKITRECITMLTEDSSVGLEYVSPSALGKPGSASYSILSSIFDQWLADKCEDAGVQMIPGITVTDLIVRDGKICGVIADDEELESNVTILADGANSLLAQKIGMRKEFSPSQVAVGVKELIELPTKVIDDRFHCTDGEGTANLFVGSPTAGKVGGGFIYTNKESVSIGIVATLSTLVQGDRSAPAMLEAFKNHPAVAPLISDGNTLEYSGHIVLEGGFDMIPELVGDGILVIGDSAGFCLNLGYAVRGLDLAIGSAECAAKTVIAASKAGDFSKSSLESYKTNLDNSFVMKDMKNARTFPQFMEQTTGLFGAYPEMATNIMKELFVVDGSDAVPLKDKVKPHVKKVGTLKLMRTAMKGMKSL